MSNQASKRWFTVIAIAIAIGAVAYLSFGGIEKNLVYYWTPSDLLAKKDSVKGATIRLGGMVQEGSLDWDAESMRLEFAMAEQPEPGGPSIKVISTGAPPQMFREGIGCIVEGKYDGTVFHSDRLMVKHSNEYQPPEHGEDLREKYKTLIPESGAGGGRAL